MCIGSAKTLLNFTICPKVLEVTWLTEFRNGEVIPLTSEDRFYEERRMGSEGEGTAYPP